MGHELKGVPWSFSAGERDPNHCDQGLILFTCGAGDGPTVRERGDSLLKSLSGRPTCLLSSGAIGVPPKGMDSGEAAGPILCSERDRDHTGRRS